MGLTLKYKVGVSIWEHEEFVITLRPEDSKRVKEIGGAMDKERAAVVSDWLRLALPELQKYLVKNERGT